MSDFQIRRGNVQFRHFLTFERGQVNLEVCTNQDYWWYVLLARSRQGHRWHGQARVLDHVEGEDETWAALLVDEATGVGTSVSGKGSLHTLLAAVAQVLADLVGPFDPQAELPRAGATRPANGVAGHR